MNSDIALHIAWRKYDLFDFFSYDKLEAEGAKAKFESLVEEHGKPNGEREMTKLAKSIRPDDNGAPPDDQTQNANAAEQDVWSRKQIKELRQQLVEKYPRLDNPMDKTLPFKNTKNKQDSSSSKEGDKVDRSHDKGLKEKRHLHDGDVEEVTPIMQSHH